MAARSHDWGQLLTGRDASGTHGIQMFGLRREQGRLAELAPVVRILAGVADREGPWRPGLVAVLAELGMESEARRELSRLAAEGIDGFRASLWLATLTYLTDACAALGRRGDGGDRLSRAGAACGNQRDDRSPGRLLRSRRPLSGHARRDAGGAGASRGALRAGAWSRTGGWERRPGWLTRPTSTGASCSDGGAGPATALRPCSARPPAWPSGSAWKDCSERSARSACPAPDGGLPGGLSPREAQILKLVASGLSNREIGEELTISEHTAANHIRSILRKTDCANRTEAASYAHRHGLAPE